MVLYPTTDTAFGAMGGPCISYAQRQCQDEGSNLWIARYDNKLDQICRYNIFPYQPFPTCKHILKHLKTAFENIMANREIAHDEQSLLCPNVFKLFSIITLSFIDIFYIFSIMGISGYNLYQSLLMSAFWILNQYQTKCHGIKFRVLESQ